MKRITILINLIFLVLSAHSQVGIKAGMNLSRSRENLGLEKSTMPGFHIGGFYDIKLSGNLYLQPQLLFSYEPTKVSSDFYQEQTHTRNEICETGWFANLPVMLLYKFPFQNNRNISVGLGGYFSYGLFGDYKFKGKMEETSGDFSEKLFPDRRSRDDYGMSAGVGYEWNKYLINLQMKYGFQQVSQPQGKAMTWMLSFGYKL